MREGNALQVFYDEKLAGLLYIRISIVSGLIREIP